jgi:monoamine oxidase
VRWIDLPLVPHQYGNSFWNQGELGKRFAPGAWCMSVEAKRIWQELAKKFRKFGNEKYEEMDRLDWWTFLQKEGFPREDLLRRDLMDSTDFWETIRMNSAYTAAAEYLPSKDEEVDETDEMDSKIEGGNERLVKAMANAVGMEKIRLEWEVKEIRRTGYSIGDKADDIASAPAHALKNWFVEDVSHANGYDWTPEKISQTAVDIERQAWQKDVYTAGAYAFYRPGQWFPVRKALIAPFKKVFFADEHIADWQRFMEGAVVTGADAAEGVLKL